uniref:AP-2 complex subunit alpha (Trinotate prediction) n=1 Tax=Henneguya salminicola TaxID=69463 RepID=A0A6G3MF18_HENSL
MANLVQRVADMAFESFAQPQMKDNLKGLEIFIADIKRCKSKKSEVKRVNRELANIRTKFCTRKNLDSYQKKKYIAKLLFIYLLGYPIEFGHLEALNLITCSNFSGKSIGYMFLSVIFSPQLDAEYVPLLISALKNDISSDRKLEAILALRACANTCFPEVIDSLFPDIYSILKKTYSFN